MVEAPTPPLTPVTASDLPVNGASGSANSVRDRADHLHRIDRRDEIFGNAAAHQLAIEPDVVGLAQHDDA